MLHELCSQIETKNCEKDISFVGMYLDTYINKISDKDNEYTKMLGKKVYETLRDEIQNIQNEFKDIDVDISPLLDKPLQVTLLKLDLTNEEDKPILILLKVFKLLEYNYKI